MNSPRRILLVDDDNALRDSLREQLAVQNEFMVTEAGTGAAGLERAKADQPDLVILDVGLPDIDGREVCRLMRKANIRCPILMLTGQHTEEDEVEGLESGANDYLIKPFRFNALLARIRTHLRSHAHSEDAVYQIGRYTFRPSAKLLLGPENQKIRLTEKETSILKFLYRAGNKVVPRETLLHEVWGYNPAVTTHTLETHIYRLRQKIEQDPARASLLLTESGGYRLLP